MAKNNTVKVTMQNKGNASVSVRSKAFSGIIPQGRSKGVEVEAEHLPKFRSDLRKRYPSITVDVEGDDEEEAAPAKPEPEPAKTAPEPAKTPEPAKKEPAPAETETAPDESGESEADDGDDGKKTSGRAKKKG